MTRLEIFRSDYTAKRLSKVNTNFAELFAGELKEAATALVDGYLKHEDFVIFSGKQDALVNADATHDGILVKEDWVTFNGKQDALLKIPFVFTGVLTSALATTPVHIVPVASVPVGKKIYITDILINVGGVDAW